LLSALEENEQPPQVFSAETQDIAKGGIGMVCSRPIAPGLLVRCEFALADHTARIPTLLKVRWTDSLEGKNQYRMGLQFLI
jgi:hypothetical protein